MASYMHVMQRDMQSVLISVKRHIAQTFILSAMLCMLSTEIVAQDWPIHRGNAALNGYSNDRVLKPSKLTWRFTAPKGQLTSVVAKDGVAFFASAKGAVYAVDIQTGKERWHKTFEKTGFTAAPTLFDDKLFVGSDRGHAIALSQKDGSELWREKCGGKIIGSANTYKRKGSGLSIIFVSWDNNVYAHDAATGKKLWSFGVENRLNATPAIVENNVIFGGCDGFVRVLDADSGKEVAAVDAGSYIAAAVSVNWPQVYIGHHEAAFLCINPMDEKIIWTYTNREEPFVSAPAVGGGRVIMGSDDQRVHCLTTKGRPLWEYRTNGKVMSSAVIVGDKVFIGSDDGFFYCLSTATGEKQWSYEIGAEVDTDPAYASGHILVSAHDGSVYAFKLEAKP